MLVEVEHLTKRFKDFAAVNDVSFALAEGEIVGLVGPNGAGKSTTIHMMLGLIEPTAGSILLFGRSLADDREAILQNLNFTSPYMAFPPRLTVLENLSVFARLYKVPDSRVMIMDLLERFGIATLRNKPVSRLSSGESTRVGICKAFINRPRLLLLDEPTAYLDPQAAIQVRETLLEMQKSAGTTILYTSHNMREVERMCKRIVFLSRGQIVASGSALQVTREILKEQREHPALEEAFVHVARR